MPHMTKPPVSPRKAAQVEQTEQRLMAAYVPVQYAFVQFFTEHLVDCAEPFDNDLERLLVMAVLGQRRLEAHVLEATYDPSNPSRMSMSASRIADVTRLPRQTVRRKLADLKARGWVDQDERHGWYVTGAPAETPARNAMRHIEARFFRRLARLHLQLAAVLEGDHIT